MVTAKWPIKNKIPRLNSPDSLESRDIPDTRGLCGNHENDAAMPIAVYSRLKRLRRYETLIVQHD